MQGKTVLLGRHDLILKDFSQGSGSHSVNRDHGDDMTPITAIRRNRNWKIREREKTYRGGLSYLEADLVVEIEYRSTGSSSRAHGLARARV